MGDLIWKTGLTFLLAGAFILPGWHEIGAILAIIGLILMYLGR